MSVTSVFLNEKTRSIKLLLSITAAGVIEIDPDDYIDDVSDGIDFQVMRFGEGNSGLSGSFGASSDNDDGLILKTKKRFQEEYLVRKVRRDAMLESIAIRESKISKIQAAMNLSLSEVFLVVVFDRNFNKWRVLPIMAICYPKVGSGSLNNVKILVDWKIGSPASDPKSTSVVQPRISRPDEFPLPPITPLKCEWTTIDELMKGNAYIVAMDTLIKTPFHASLSRHWMPEKPTDSLTTNARSKSPNKDQKRGGKESKAAVVEPISSKDVVCVDPGLPPVTLLRLDISSFYHMVSVDGDGNEMDEQMGDSNSIYDASRHSFDGDALAADAIEEQLKELARFNEKQKDDQSSQLADSSSNGSLDVAPVLALKPKKGYLSLSLMVHGDMTTSPHTYDDINPINPTKKKDPSQKNVLPGDVVIILQVRKFHCCMF